MLCLNKKHFLSLLLALMLISEISSCNLTPGVPIPPPPRQNFYTLEPEVDCRGVEVSEVHAVEYTFAPGDWALIMNIDTNWGVIAPVSGDGSLSVEIPAKTGERITIRRRLPNGNESMPIEVKIPCQLGEC